MTANLIPAGERHAATVRVEAQRIGLIADDHNLQEDGSDLPAEALSAFRGVDLILHLGHMGFRDVLARGVLDRLEEVAPVLSVRDVSTREDGERYVTPADGTRVSGLTRVVDTGFARVGMVHNLEVPPGPSIVTPPGEFPRLDDLDVRSAVIEKFDGEVDVIAFAGSHRAGAVCAEGVLFVNPGSPTYPRGPGRRRGGRTLGTVGILDVSGGGAVFETLEVANFPAES